MMIFLLLLFLIKLQFLHSVCFGQDKLAGLEDKQDRLPVVIGSTSAQLPPQQAACALIEGALMSPVED